MSPNPDNPLLKELKFQLTVTRAMLAALDLDQVLYVILSGITHGDGLNFNRAVLFLARERRSELRVSTATGPASKEEAHRIWEAIEASGLDLQSLIDRYGAARDRQAQTLTRQMGELSIQLDREPPALGALEVEVPLAHLVAHVAARNEPFVANERRAVYLSPSGDKLEFSPFALVPIALRESILGVILVDNAYNGRPILAQETRGLVTLANLAAIAIEKARLHERLTEMASLDGLTGVFNRRHYEQRLEQEVARAKRVGRNLGMLVVDIDHFKDVNDHHGHECGDQVLRDVAATIKARLRAEDLVARYGGEEFVVLLTGGPSEHEALLVAEKLRRSIANNALGGLAGGAVTVSIGAASAEPTELDPRELFRGADRALYRAKRSGRNRCVAASALASLDVLGPPPSGAESD